MCAFCVTSHTLANRVIHREIQRTPSGTSQWNFTLARRARCDTSRSPPHTLSTLCWCGSTSHTTFVQGDWCPRTPGRTYYRTTTSTTRHNSRHQWDFTRVFRARCDTSVFPRHTLSTINRLNDWHDREVGLHGTLSLGVPSRFYDESTLQHEPKKRSYVQLSSA
jgi:hypothetical protein